MWGRRHNQAGRMLLLALLLLGVGFTAKAETVTLEATLILASDNPAPQDMRLDRIEYKLRRIFGFAYYAHYGQGSATAALPAEVTLELGHGYRLEVSARKKDGKVRAEVRWMQADQILLSTRVGLKKGVPTILGGPPHEGGNLIVALVAK